MNAHFSLKRNCFAWPARFLACGLCLAFPAADAGEPSLASGNARVVLVGDSITGLSRNASHGFAHLMEAALRATYPDAEPQIIALGGSGQSVGSWRGIEKNSRTKEIFLDVRGIEVKGTLDQPADVLVVMLGMNDVLAPYVHDTPKSLERWQEHLRDLVSALRERLDPKTVGLASITPCTEDPASPKNRLINAINEQVRIVAHDEGAVYLPTAETVWEILRQGRTRRHDFHVTYDFVHPNLAGHLGIAVGMLAGLAEPAAAEWLRTERLEPLLHEALVTGPGLSWQIDQVAPAETPGRFRFRLAYWWPATAEAGPPKPRVTLSVPDGWEVTRAQSIGVTGEFTVSGIPDRARNILTLTGQAGDEQRQAELFIPAPWLVAAKLIQAHWTGGQFEAEKAQTAVDGLIETSGAFTAAVDVGKGQTLLWQPLFPSINYTGLDVPASVDFAAVTHAANFEGGYAARRIHSERERPVKLAIGTRQFAGNSHLTVWLNGRMLYQDKLARTAVDAQLEKGWNTLVFKTNHRTWQWQVSVGVEAVDGGSVDDLRYALP